MVFRRWIEGLWELFFPHLCVVCENKLADGEEVLCTLCNIRLPRTNLHLCKDHKIEKLFWGKVHLERATSFFYYQKGSPYNRLIHRLKYYGGKKLADRLGVLVASELLRENFFEGIDLLVPVPLHPLREKERGYNQSEWIIKGISAITGIPYRMDVVSRIINTDTQVQQSIFDRMRNTEGAFKWKGCDTISGLHILVVDDVLTTGSTLASCLLALKERSGLKISILTLCVAH